MSSAIHRKSSIFLVTKVLPYTKAVLYRARKSGQPYQKGGWVAESIGDNAWRVVFNKYQV